jgi:hypothetical protein
MNTDISFHPIHPGTAPPQNVYPPTLTLRYDKRPRLYSIAGYWLSSRMLSFSFLLYIAHLWTQNIGRHSLQKTTNRGGGRGHFSYLQQLGPNPEPKHERVCQLHNSTPTARIRVHTACDMEKSYLFRWLARKRIHDAHTGVNKCPPTDQCIQRCT